MSSFNDCRLCASQNRNNEFKSCFWNLFLKWMTISFYFFSRLLMFLKWYWWTKVNFCQSFKIIEFNKIHFPCTFYSDIYIHILKVTVISLTPASTQHPEKNVLINIKSNEFNFKQNNSMVNGFVCSGKPNVAPITPQSLFLYIPKGPLITHSLYRVIGIHEFSYM